jgi:hypothetical protein
LLHVVDPRAEAGAVGEEGGVGPAQAGYERITVAYVFWGGRGGKGEEGWSSLGAERGRERGVLVWCLWAVMRGTHVEGKWCQIRWPLG